MGRTVLAQAKAGLPIGKREGSDLLVVVVMMVVMVMMMAVMMTMMMMMMLLHRRCVGARRAEDRHGERQSQSEPKR
jgi:flagellar basal body-associated protein FliL